MAAASRVFAARPYHVVCMDDVAEAARVGKGTLYRYFPSKEDLYLGVVAEAFDLLDRAARPRRGGGAAAARTALGAHDRGDRGDLRRATCPSSG